MKRVLVALDASPRAPAVLAEAAKLAELANASLVLFRAVGIPPELPPELLNVTGRELEHLLLETARADLARLARAVPNAHIEAVHAAFASPWDGICRTARDVIADLIVIGSHGYGGLDRVLGTTAAKVVNHADRNVLVVRAMH